MNAEQYLIELLYPAEVITKSYGNVKDLKIKSLDTKTKDFFVDSASRIYEQDINDTIIDLITCLKVEVIAHAICVNDERLADHDRYNFDKAFEFCSWPELGADFIDKCYADICAESDISFEFPEEPEDLSEDEMAAMSPNGDPLAE